MDRSNGNLVTNSEKSPKNNNSDDKSASVEMDFNKNERRKAREPDTNDHVIAQKDSENCNHAPIPPDGGWGWVITLSSFMVGVLVDGICFTFGFFFKEFMEHFDSNKSVTSSISSVLNGSYMIVGPIIGGLVNVFGCRRVAIFGSLLSSAAFFACTYSPTVEVMIVLYGFIGGIGFGCMYLPAIVMVGYYFDKRRALATGIAVCGSGIGSFVFAPICEYLLRKYDWRGAMWIISAIVLNGAVFASLYRPLEFTKTIMKEDKMRPNDGSDAAAIGTTEGSRKGSQLSESERREDEYQVKMETENDRCQRIPIFKSAADELRQTIKKPIYRCRSMDVYNNCNNMKQKDIVRLTRSQILTTTLGSRRHLNSSENSPKVLNPLSRKDILYGGSVTRLPEYKLAGSEENYVRSMLNVNTTQDSDAKSGEGLSKCSSLCTLKVLTGMFDISLLRSPSFDIYCLSCFLCMMGFFIPFNYVPALSRDFGMTTTQGTWLISTIGILNTVARILVGYISDKDWTDCLIVNNISLVIGGVFTMFVPFYKVYWLLIIHAIVFGTAIAAFVSLRSIIIVELLGIDKLTNSFGIVVLCQGLSSFIGSPIAGALSDHTGDYKASFYLAGATIALSGIICIPLRRISAWEKKKMAAKRQHSGAEMLPMITENGDLKSNGIKIDPEFGF